MITSSGKVSDLYCDLAGGLVSTTRHTEVSNIRVATLLSSRRGTCILGSVRDALNSTQRSSGGKHPDFLYTCDQENKLSKYAAPTE